MKTIEQIATEFTVWTIESMYELTYQDVDEDGKVWTNYNDVNHGLLGREDEKRYTIKEIYNHYLIENNNEIKMNNKIQGEQENQLIDLIGIYGEAKIIKYLSKSIIDKEKRLKEHQNLKAK